MTPVTMNPRRRIFYAIQSWQETSFAKSRMSTRHKLLLLDDDQDLLELYREILSRLPSKPEIYTAQSGARAISLLQSEPFTLLISDLSMPKMDGLQVLAIVRRKFPQLRTAVLTSVADEQFRTRAYSMGIDLFLEKPHTGQEISFFLDCIESLLGKQEETGFRGVQSKSLVDIIQLECLSQSSAVLKITNGDQEGRIWILEGSLIDAEAHGVSGEDAFRKILSWKTGNFEFLPAEPERPRQLSGSYQGLLLETAQALDESGAGQSSDPANPSAVSPLASLAHFNGVQFIVTVPGDEPKAFQSWGVENAEQVAHWAHQTMENFRDLGERLQAGPITLVEGIGPSVHLTLLTRAGTELCAGFDRSLSDEIVRETMKRIINKWVS
jgi:CheY-like chemotaxis protein